MARSRLSMDVDITPEDVAALTSADAFAGFLARLGYDTSDRLAVEAEALGLADADKAFRHIEVFRVDEEDFLRIVFVQVRSVTAKARNDLVRVLGRQMPEHVIVLTKDFRDLEFVLIDKEKRRRVGPATTSVYRPVPRPYTIQRKDASRLDLRFLRRFTFTQRDGLDQFDKLRSAFMAAAYTGRYYQNRALFADHYLNTRLQESAAWRESPNEAFAAVKHLMADARDRLAGQNEAAARQQLFEPLFQALGYKVAAGKNPQDDAPTADYVLQDAKGRKLTAALVYRWDRWLDGPDASDTETPEENPGAAVVSILERGDAEWAVVTNGKHWRLYSRRAHSRSTNFYEVDLSEALAVSGDTDPAEAFRYWWLFFRPAAFAPLPKAEATADVACWLDTIVAGSRDYAKKVEDRLKLRVFHRVVPQLAMGFLADRKKRLGVGKAPTAEELEEVREGCLTLLYRLLFLLYAESRDLLPIRESPYLDASLKKLKEEVAAAAGTVEDEVEGKLAAACRADATGLYDRLSRLFAVMDAGDPALNVPTYNGGLFLVRPPAADTGREAQIARFLNDHKVPDRFLAQAIDHLARDPDEKHFGLVPIDYKSLGVRQLGSIYEGLLEFRLKIAAEDMATVKQKGKELAVPLAKAGRKGRTGDVIRKGEVYLATDKGERKATGSYYTPDHIVVYIVDNTVGPVLAEKLDALVPALRAAQKTFQRHLANARAHPLTAGDEDPRAFAAEKTYAEHADLVEKLFDCKVLDPAMGSGHFLVEAVDHITDKLLDFLNRFPNNPIATGLERTRRSILESLSDQGVAVDPDRLTDVHLLKRHVLKRCIYGVDLNPMAVELAKVSLWLDAFTLGAPLSFLDHHLRCGNSLIGEMKVSEHILPGSDREAAFLLAITKMLEIVRSADATAADVRASNLMFAEIEKLERPFRERLNVNTASHFIDVGNVDRAGGFAFQEGFDPGAVPEMLQRSATGFVSSQALADERRFFHWPLAFPEVFFGVREGTERHVEEKTSATRGFDAIVGNPPYVRQETLKADKGYLKAAFKAVYDATCDLYVYFMEREIETLRSGGRMGMIVANKWLRAGYGAKLRDYLVRTAKPEVVVDFGHSPIFPDADTFPCIPVFTRRHEPLARDAGPSYSETVTSCRIPREHYDPAGPIAPYVMIHGGPLPTRSLNSDGWNLEDPRVHAVLQRMKREGVPLRQVAGTEPFFGIKTGFNEAFYINEEQRESLVKESPASQEIIVPLLRGRDLRRWTPRRPEVFLIAIASTLNRNWPWSSLDHDAEAVFAKVLPAVFRHLSRYRGQLIARKDKGEHWWELRSCDYYAQFAKPKLVFQRIGYHSQIALDHTGSLTNDSTIMLPAVEPGLIAALNSPIGWSFMFKTFPHKKDEAVAMDIASVNEFPLPTRLDDAAFAQPVEQLVCASRRLGDWENATLARVGQIADLGESPDKALSWLRRPEDDFIRLVGKASGRRLSSAAVAELAAFRRQASDELGRFLTEQLALEKQLAVLVEDAYGLTPEERQLLRATRPVRDPIDVLEAKLAGLDADSPTEEGQDDE